MKLIYKNNPKKITIIGYTILIIIGILLTIVRWVSIFNNDIVIINAEINSHISNFSLSLILYLGIGYSWLLFGVKFYKIIFLGLFLIIANLVCEIFMGFINTPDIIDAIYGIIGIIITFIFLIIVNKYGIIK